MEITNTKRKTEAVGIYETIRGQIQIGKKKASQDQNTKEHHHLKEQSKGNKPTKKIVGWWSEMSQERFLTETKETLGKLNVQ